MLPVMPLLIADMATCLLFGLEDIKRKNAVVLDSCPPGHLQQVVGGRDLWGLLEDVRDLLPPLIGLPLLH